MPTLSNPYQRNPMRLLLLLVATVTAALLVSCARMGQPDGGWYDETPPRVIGASPAEGATDVSAKKIEILFDEYIKIENATEKVVVSPPQMEAPDIKAAGRRIVISLHDSLKAATTYTVDFSDAISDNNEGNPMGNYTYSFSTGAAIDTLQVSGYVIEADNLEPVKGILVGLYAELADSAFTHSPMLRVSRTDSRGHFTVKGVAPGTYRIYALQDADGNYLFSQKSEMLAFQTATVTPSVMADVRQDTVWTDSLHIRDIARVGYTRFLPDDIVLRAFTETLTDRYLVKSERAEADHFSLYFSYGGDVMPEIRGLDFDAAASLIAMPSLHCDTIDYWLRDTTLINRDTLTIEARYLMTDTTGVLRQQTDTLELLSRQPYARRMRQAAKEYETWQKKQDKLRRRGEPFDSVMPPKPMALRLSSPTTLAPDQNVTLESTRPVARVDSSRIHLYVKHDTLWYEEPHEIIPVAVRPDSARGGTAEYVKQYLIRAAWRPHTEYSLELDSMAFTDIYGAPSPEIRQGLRVPSEDEYATVLFSIPQMAGTPVIVELLNTQDQPVKRISTSDGNAKFFYLKPNTYYARLIVDTNGNGRWDTGDYASGLQPEQVYYYTEKIECKAKWDLSLTWNPTSQPEYRQKPVAITKQKADRARKIQQRNMERARTLGVPYPGARGQ